MRCFRILSWISMFLLVSVFLLACSGSGEEIPPRESAQTPASQEEGSGETPVFDDGFEGGDTKEWQDPDDGENEDGEDEDGGG